MSIIFIFGTILVLTVVQLFVCHFTFWWILSTIARVLFSLRLVGAIFKLKTIAIIEGVALGGMFVWNMIFAKDDMPWLRLIATAVFGLLCLGIMFFDDLTEVYVSVDEEDY